ncbi:hypothetical protein FI667_g1612, partial [Globisporangium splendens]
MGTHISVTPRMTHQQNAVFARVGERKCAHERVPIPPLDGARLGVQGKKTPAAIASFVSEGFVAADSATTFARVIMTAKPLDIEDFYTHENYDQQIKSSDITPHALFCLPIRNAHHAIVGVFQVVSMVKTENESELPSGSSNPSSEPVTVSTVSRSFTDAYKRSLEFLAVVAGSAIWNLILVREHQTAQNRIEGNSRQQ